MKSTTFFSLIAVASAQYNTPAGSACGMNTKAKSIPATGDCEIAGGIFSIGFPGELMSYLVTKGFSMGSGSDRGGLTGTKSTGTGGTGPYPAVSKSDSSLPGHTIYAPATPPNITMPFLVWGNGACMPSPFGYEAFLKEIASYGYVIAADGPMTKAQSNVKDMRDSVTWAKSPAAAKYGKLDLKKIATMGHSCGGLEGMSFSYHNPDVALTMMFNIATFHDDKRYLMKELKAPIAWFVGNPSDMGYENSRRDYTNLTDGHQAFWSSLETGHMGTFGQANGGKQAKAAVQFLEWQFRGDSKAKDYCLNGMSKEGWTVQSKNWK